MRRILIILGGSSCGKHLAVEYLKKHCQDSEYHVIQKDHSGNEEEVFIRVSSYMNTKTINLEEDVDILEEQSKISRINNYKTKPDYEKAKDLPHYLHRHIIKRSHRYRNKKP